MGDQITAYKSYFQVGRSNSGKRLTDFQMTSDYEASSAQWTRFRLQVPGDTQYVMIKLKGGSPWLYVDDIYVTEVPVPVATAATVMGETRYVTTFYDATNDFRLSAGAKAYTVNKNGDNLVFHQVGVNGRVIPHGTAVVVVADSASATLTKLNTTTVTAYAGNVLVGLSADRGGDPRLRGDGRTHG